MTTDHDQSALSRSEDHLVVKPFLGITPAAGYRNDVKTPVTSFPPSTTTSSYPYSVPPTESDASSGPLTSPATPTTIPHSPSKAYQAASNILPTRIPHHTHSASDASISKSPGVRGPRPPTSKSTTLLRNRMQRLQDLVQELNQALSDGNSDGERIAELRGRINELTREDHSGHGEHIELNWRESTAPSAVPPPYQR
ncbi:hypothetical protein C0991_003478 [Blastosporella zonata]|nr:hypothetical protein C0991_003478 [Blastosporella zonata]